MNKEKEILTDEMQQIKESLVPTKNKGYNIQIIVTDQETNREFKGEIDSKTLYGMSFNGSESKNIIWEIVEGLVKVCEDSKKI
jgi:ubiquitin